MPFPPEFLRELNDRNRIEDIAASYVTAAPGQEPGGAVPLPQRENPLLLCLSRE